MRSILFSSLLFSSLLLLSQYSQASTPYNIESTGKKNSNYKSGEELDDGFNTISELYTYLSRSYGGRRNFVTETALDNLFCAISCYGYSKDFSTEYGGTNTRIDTIPEFTMALQWMEDNTGNNVFDLFQSANDVDDPVVHATESIQIVSPVPSIILNKYRLDNSTVFYDKVAYANGGLPLFATNNTTNLDIKKAEDVINKMFAQSPSILSKLVETNHKVILISYGSGEITQIPGIPRRNTWRYIIQPPAPQIGGVVVAPSNEGYNTSLIHELGHASGAMLGGVRNNKTDGLSPTFYDELDALYNKEVKILQKFKGSYAAVNASEFWAEAVRSYFNSNGSGGNNPICTRNDLKKYSVDTFNFVQKFFTSPPIGTWKDGCKA